MIPSAQTCFALMDQYGMPDHIRDHSMMVEKVARLIAEGLTKAGVSIRIDKVSAGARLHDIAKTMCLNNKENHAVKGKEICLKHGLDEIADIVAEHVVLSDFKSDGEILEKEIIYYADKRVNHNKVVSLDKRLSYLIDRYGANNKTITRRIIKNFDLCKKVERKLFHKLDFEPENLAEQLESR